jgi:hypothetical protein
MKQFINGSDAAYAVLEAQALSSCVVFRDQEMPPGTSPTRARVGFETDPVDGTAKLLVDPVEAYRGESSGVRAWLAAGEKRFRNFGQLKDWVRKDLATCYRPAPAPPQPLTAAAPPGAAAVATRPTLTGRGPTTGAKVPSCLKCQTSRFMAPEDSGPTYKTWRCTQCNTSRMRRTLLGKALPFATLGFLVLGLPGGEVPPTGVSS